MRNVTRVFMAEGNILNFVNDRLNAQIMKFEGENPGARLLNVKQDLKTYIRGPSGCDEGCIVSIVANYELPALPA